MNTAITVEGNLTADPTHRTTATRGPDTTHGGPDAVLTPVTNLRIAVSDRYRDPAGAWLTTDPVVYDVTIWGPPPPTPPTRSVAATESSSTANCGCAAGPAKTARPGTPPPSPPT